MVSEGRRDLVLRSPGRRGSGLVRAGLDRPPETPAADPGVSEGLGRVARRASPDLPVPPAGGAPVRLSRQTGTRALVAEQFLSRGPLRGWRVRGLFRSSEALGGTRSGGLREEDGRFSRGPDWRGLLDRIHGALARRPPGSLDFPCP